jgi:hypothetical protein
MMNLYLFCHDLLEPNKFPKHFLKLPDILPHFAQNSKQAYWAQLF